MNSDSGQASGSGQTSGSGKVPGGFLVVDDISINIFITQELLQPYGLPVDTAASGQEAVAKIEQGNQYDIIFMDHMMPGMNGTEATKIIRSKGYNGYIIVLTAHDEDDDEQHYLDSGFDKYMRKPIDSDELDELINEYVDFPLQGVFPGSDIEMSEMDELFIEDAERTIEILEGLFCAAHTFTDDDLDTYETTVHGIKSALAGIEEQELSDYAYELELAAKAGNIDIIENETPSFLDELRSLVDEIKHDTSE